MIVAILIYWLIALVIFLSIAFYNYKQDNFRYTIDSAAVGSVAASWSISLPLILVVYMIMLFSDLFNDISENGFKNDTKRKSN